MVKNKYILIVILTGIFTFACSPTKYLQKDELLYKKTKIEFDEKNGLQKRGLRSDLKKVAVPEPNKEFLGLIPFRLYMYNLAGDSVPDKGLRHWLKNKVGEKPVIYEQFHRGNSIRNISSFLYGKGFFDSNVRASEVSKNQKIKLKYSIDLNERYFIDTLIYGRNVDSLVIPYDKFKTKSLISEGAPYDIENLQQERKRIARNLRNEGYYYFVENNLIFKVDSNQKEKKLDLYLDLKDNVPPKDLKRYRIGDIKIYPDYNIGRKESAYDTSSFNGISYHYENERIDRKVLDNSVILRQGDYFSTDAYSATLNKLMGLGVFKYANISFNRDSLTGNSEEKNTLNTNIYLTQSIPVSARIELQGVTKSNNYTGPYLYLSYVDRNTFGGAVRFEVNINSGFETQLSKRNNLFSYELGIQGKLSFPRFIFPFIDFNKYLSKRYTPNTDIELGYDIVNRVNYFTSSSFETSYGYKWQETESKFHSFRFFTLNYSNLLRTTAEFDAILDENPLLAESFNEELILSISYNYTYDEQLQKIDNFSTYFSLNTEAAGNTLNLADKLVNGFEPDAAGGRILGLKYTQFVKATTDLRFIFALGENSTFVNRYLIGAGLPYGNSNTLPYNKQYFAGGVNSLRGFPYRSVGPGSFQGRAEDRFLFSHNGNFKLETNFELRFPLAGPLNGAVFLDAGNVWLWEDSEDKPGSAFRFSDFSRQIAVNSGFGIRLDVSFFVIRLDLGIPLRRPFTGENDSYWIDFQPFSPEWIKEYPVLNFAIGYPF